MQKDPKKGTIILVIVLVVVILIIGVVVAVYLNNKSKTESDDSSGQQSNDNLNDQLDDDQLYDDDNLDNQLQQQIDYDEIDYVSIFSHYEYIGTEVKLPEGEYTLSDLNNLGINYDTVGSIKLNGNNLMLHLYTEDNFEGYVLPVIMDYPIIHQPFNEVYSIKVIKANITVHK